MSEFTVNELKDPVNYNGSMAYIIKEDGHYYDLLVSNADYCMDYIQGVHKNKIKPNPPSWCIFYRDGDEFICEEFEFEQEFEERCMELFDKNITYVEGHL